MSQGPYEMTINDDEGSRYLAGRFMSIWQAGDNDKWKIIFDTGTASAPIEAPLQSPWDEETFTKKCSGTTP